MTPLPLTPVLIDAMLAHVGPDPDPTFGEVSYDSEGRVDADSIADSILALQRTRGESTDPDAESMLLLDRLARDLLVDPTEEEVEKEAQGLWQGALHRVSDQVQPEDVVAVDKVNDADQLGTETPAYLAMLDQPATLLLGEMWGARDRRNTQDADWKPVTMSWVDWIIGGEGSKNAPAWGFSRHPVRKDKEGSCIVLGSSIGQARKAKAMDTMYAMGLDIDAGFPLDSMLDKLEALGLFCLVYTTHSHGRRGLQLKHDDVIRKLKIKPSELTLGKVQEYLRSHDKNRYEESFIEAITIKTAKKQVKEGLVIDLSTPPLDKYRLIFPLEAPVKLMDLAPTETEYLAVWENKITGLARETLGVHFDTSATDPSRLFYTARHSKDSADWYCAIVRGDPLKFADVPLVKKSTYVNNRKAANLNPFEMAGGAGEEGDRPAQALTPSGASLNDWHTLAKERFNMADLVEDLCSDRIRNAGGEARGHVHIECPFESEHTTEGGTATMVVNALDSKNGYWTWFCKHDACQGRHKLAFLEEALRQNWFDEDQLFGDSVYMMEGPDDDEVLEDVALPDRAAREADTAASNRDALLSLADGFDIDTTEPEVREVIRVALKTKADKAALGRLKTAVVAKTSIGARAYNGLMAEEEAKQKRKGAKKSSGSMDVYDHYKARNDYIAGRIRAVNSTDPAFFQYMEQFATADAVRGRIRVLDYLTFSTEVQKIVDFFKVRSTDKSEQQVGAKAPNENLEFVFNDATFRDSLPALSRVVTTPFFASDGTLVSTPGYHAGAEVYLSPNGLQVTGVSPHPAADEANAAARYIVEEVLADFPLGGLSRAEIMEQAFTGTGVPAVANVLAMILLPFVRDMIRGATPLHLVNKPAPGTGAGYLVACSTIIPTGFEAPAMTMPPGKDELAKTLFAALIAGGTHLFFDNVNHEMDSAELASVATAPEEGYEARVLGKSQKVTVKIKQVLIIAANTLSMSEELLRRGILIDMDARMPHPDLRDPEKFRHRDIRGWCRDNRAELVRCCLTIIQHWVAEGQEPGKYTLASFENWAEIMGGILDTAGVRGFMGNAAALKDDLANGEADAMGEVFQAIAEAFHSHTKLGNDPRLYIGTKDLAETRKGKIGVFDILHAMDDVPRLEWGETEQYKDGEMRVVYSNRNKASAKFKAEAKRTRRVEIDGKAWNVRYEREKDAGAKSWCYRQVLTAP